MHTDLPSTRRIAVFLYGSCTPEHPGGGRASSLDQESTRQPFSVIDIVSHQSVNIDCLTYPVLTIDFAGTVSSANSAASVYFGANGTGQLLGISAADAMRHLTRASDGQAVLTADWFLSAVGIHCDAIDAKGREFVVSLVPRPDATSTRVGWMLSLSDQTDARLAQRQREAALRFLTHDLRAPISSVVALLDLHRFNGSAMTQEELLGRIEGHAHRLLDMVEAFVELTEVELRVRRLCDVDLVDVTAEAIDQVWEEAKKLDVRLYPIGDQWETAICCGEREPIKRAVRRLLLNAIRRSPSAAPVAWELEQRDAHWVVAISDSGAPSSSESGIDPGLAMVVATAAKYGGVLEIQHNPAGGSTYRFVIPK